MALEALKGIKTIQQIAKEFDDPPGAGLRVEEDDGPERRRASSAPARARTDAEDFERERDQLHAKIGQQAVELDWLTKKSKQLGL